MPRSRSSSLAALLLRASLALAPQIVGTGAGASEPDDEPFGAEDFGAEQHAVRIPEPMVFDLVRGLGARRGELEVNTLVLLPMNDWDDRHVDWAPEIEYALLDGVALEFELPFEDGRFLHLTTEEAATAGSPAACRLVNETDLLTLAPSARAPVCGGFELPGEPGGAGTGTTAGLDPGATSTEDPPTSGVVTVAGCRLAIETDFQFFQKFGNTPDATAYVTGLIAAISDVYFEHVQTTLSIAYLGLHSTSADAGHPLAFQALRNSLSMAEAPAPTSGAVHGSAEVEWRPR